MPAAVACLADSRSTRIHQSQHWTRAQITRINPRAEVKSAFQRTLSSQHMISYLTAEMWRSPPSESWCQRAWRWASHAEGSCRTWRRRTRSGAQALSLSCWQWRRRWSVRVRWRRLRRVRTAARVESHNILCISLTAFSYGL